MGFINKKTDKTVIRAKLTDTGRNLLSKGLLNYRYWSIGDTEIDYKQTYDITDSDNRSSAEILSPIDLQTSIKYTIPSYYGGDGYNIVNGAQSIEKNVFGTNISKGFFDNNLFKDDFVDNLKTKKYFKGILETNTASINGSKILNFTNKTGNCEVGDIVMVACLNSTQTPLSNAYTLPNVAPYLFFKVETVNPSSITIDRELPNIGSGLTKTYAYVINGGDAINDYYSTFEPTYWDYDNLSFQTNEGTVANDVKIWNFNIIYKDNIIGLDNNIYKNNKYFPSRVYSGILNIDDTLPKNQRVYGVIHYTNNSTANIYGESFKRGSLKLTIQNIMYHSIHASGNATSMGVTFLSSNNPNELDYDDLIDSFGNTIGRVYFKNQIIILTDEELVTALSYRGNRSWTLPKINSNAVPSPNGSNSFVDKDKELYLTYSLTSTTNGFKNNIPCQKYSILSNEISGQDSAMVFFPKNQFPFLRTTFDSTGGFTANKVQLIAQLVEKGKQPNPSNWKIIDITTTFKTGGGNISQTDLEGKTYTLNQSVYESAPQFKLSDLMDNLPKLGESNGLLFGEENVFIGNVDTIPSATIHKVSFSFLLAFNQFKVSNNPTYELDGGKPIYVSEVGIYDENKELVITGKTSSPLKKGDGDTILLQVDLDF